MKDEYSALFSSDCEKISRQYILFRIIWILQSNRTSSLGGEDELLPLLQEHLPKRNMEWSQVLEGLLAWIGEKHHVMLNLISFHARNFEFTRALIPRSERGYCPRSMALILIGGLFTKCPTSSVLENKYVQGTFHSRMISTGHFEL